jgi:hypothetical protein
MMRITRLALAGLLLAGVSLAWAADDAPPAGNWKLSIPLSQNGKALWLVNLDKKEGKWQGKVLSSAEGIPTATLEKLRVTKEQMAFTIKLPSQSFNFEFRLPTEKKPKLFGTVSRGPTGGTPAELEQTTLASLDPFELSKITLTTQKDGAAVTEAALRLLGMAAEKKAKPEEVRAWAARAVKAADPYGPRWKRDVLLIVVGVLGEQKGYESIALTVARQAERLLEDKDRPGVRKRVLDSLANALKKAGRDDDAKEVEARIKKIDFTIKAAPFAGRKGKGDDVILVELFTGAQCPPCVAADIAFDALGKTFKPTEVVRLQYHLHIPGPDPLTNPDTEARAEYYGRAIRGTPTLFLNGSAAAGGGGGKADAWDKYDEYLEDLLPLLDKTAKVKLKASAQRKGAKISIDVSATEVKQKASDELRVRVALVEEQVAYTGSNKLSEHHHVVRAFAGGVKGEKLAKDKPFAKKLTVDLDELRKELSKYLEETNKDNPFPNKDRPLDLKKLRVVAFVQNDATREVLQAIQVDVSE